MTTTDAGQITVRLEEVTRADEQIVDAVRDLLSAVPHVTKHVPTTEDVQAMADSPTTTLLVARDEGGEIVGMLELARYHLVSGPRAWIENVVVAPEAKGQRIGQRLMERALELIGEIGAEEAEVIVPSTGSAARNMVTRIGFRRNHQDTYRKRLT